jgi:hypothetical protein
MPGEFYGPEECPQCGGKTRRFPADHPVNSLIEEHWKPSAEKYFRKRYNLREAFVRKCDDCGHYMVDYIRLDGRKFVEALVPRVDPEKASQRGPRDCPECLKPAAPLAGDDPRWFLVNQYRDRNLTAENIANIASEELLFCEPHNTYITFIQMKDGTGKGQVYHPSHDLRRGMMGNIRRMGPIRPIL